MSHHAHDIPPKEYPKRTPEQICNAIEKSIIMTANRYLECMEVAKTTNDRVKCEESVILFARSDAKHYYQAKCQPNMHIN
jgi:hypothetical protein